MATRTSTTLGQAADGDGVDEAMLNLVTAHRGTMAARSGSVGRSPGLHLSRTPGEITVMRVVKGARDPKGLRGPGTLPD